MVGGISVLVVSARFKGLTLVVVLPSSNFRAHSSKTFTGSFSSSGKGMYFLCKQQKTCNMISHLGLNLNIFMLRGNSPRHPESQRDEGSPLFGTVPFAGDPSS